MAEVYAQTKFYIDESHFGEDGQQPMECDDSKPLQSELQFWLDSLPPSWRQRLRAPNKSSLLSSIRYFEDLLLGFEIVLTDLQSFLSNRKSPPRFPYLCDVNDEEFDKRILETTKAKATVKDMQIEGDLTVHLQLKMSECIEKKTKIIGCIDEIEKLNGKPDGVSLTNWLCLPVLTRQQMLTMDKNTLIRFLIEVYADLSREKHILQGVKKDRCDVEQQCKQLAEKNFKIQQDRADMESKIDIQHRRIIELENAVENRNAEILRNRKHLNKIARENNAELVRQLQDKLVKAQSKLKELTVQNTSLTDEKQKLLTRLSVIAGEKLTQNNPAITDLSDEHRPIKLAEKFSQMYDDMWTDALEEFTKHKIDEVKSVRFLLTVVMSAFKFCCDTSVVVDVSTCEKLVWFDGQEIYSKASTTNINEDGRKALLKCVQEIKHHHSTEILATAVERFTSVLKEMISAFVVEHRPGSFQNKQQSVESNATPTAQETNVQGPSEGGEENIQPIQQQCLSLSMQRCKENKPCMDTRLVQSCRTDFSKPLHGKPVDLKDITFVPTRSAPERGEMCSNSQTSCSEREMCKEFPFTLGFAQNCVELCWRMRTNAPPVELDDNIPEDRKFNTDIYKAYTKSGEKIEYVVWPAMYLYKKGPLLSKGVAQGQPK